MMHIYFKSSFLFLFLLIATHSFTDQAHIATPSASKANKSKGQPASVKLTQTPNPKQPTAIAKSSSAEKNHQVKHQFVQNHSEKKTAPAPEKKIASSNKDPKNKTPESLAVNIDTTVKSEPQGETKKRILLDPTKTTSAARRKRKSLYKQKKVTMRDMTYEEMEEAKNQRIKDKNLEAAIKYAEKMIPLCKDMHKQRDLTLELADLLFDNAQLDKAGKVYQEFVKLYPGTNAIEHASYRAILCSFYGILDSQRDQTKTQETLDLTVAFLERAEIFTERNEEVVAIQKKCYERLVESEMNVLNYYLQNERFNAAQVRIDGLRKDFVPKMADLEPRLLTTEIIIADQQGKTELATEKRLTLQNKYPTFKEITTVIAQAKEKSFVDKF
jgi:outer membrane assembly lipoprotein YfiO